MDLKEQHCYQCLSAQFTSTVNAVNIVLNRSIWKLFFFFCLFKVESFTTVALQTLLAFRSVTALSICYFYTFTVYIRAGKLPVQSPLHTSSLCILVFSFRQITPHPPSYSNFMLAVSLLIKNYLLF